MQEVVNMRSTQFDPATMAYIGRRKGSDQHFGNPFTFHEGTLGSVKVASREESVTAFREWLLGNRYTEIEPERRQWILMNLWRLRGKTLACYCAPLPCHGSVLVEFVSNVSKRRPQ